MRTKNAPVIRLKDYTPPAYLIDTADLDIALNPANTVVKARLTVRKPDYTKAGSTLVLDGDDLTLVRLSIDGEQLGVRDFQTGEDSLTIKTPPSSETFVLDIETSISPERNTKLTGLYRSNGVFCTQCEAEGFRRITYFLDRPDVLSVYMVRLEADRDSCPLLLANGNPVESGELDGNRHFAVWSDPHPKPCYLFAVVGGDLDVLSDTFSTASGKSVDLNIYVEKGKAGMASFAMDALKRAMIWDEQEYGREYDLDIFNIVAVSDFNMGAMENKGLNIFNDKYVLADENLATDSDYEHIEAIIAHEYFHNWTGNRITCRDWFQLCLKEGLTVYRDQEFSADQRSRAVQRIQQVRTLRAGQFPEDAGPLAHPVRPHKYREINNFYTATVYQKGAELVRMLATLVGPEIYRRATDLYFERCDGEAAQVEDFLTCFADASGLALTQFALWYEQAGTPTVKTKEDYNEQAQRYTLTLSQQTPATPNQDTKQPVVIPIRFGLLSPDGKEMPVETESSLVRDNVIVFDKEAASVAFEGVTQKPSASLLRSFSAPVILRQDEHDEAVLLRAQHDSDPYNRWSALNGLLLRRLTDCAKLAERGEAVLDATILESLRTSAFDLKLDPAFRAQVLTLPSDQDIARELGKNVDPDAVVGTRQRAHIEICKTFGDEGFANIRTLTNLDGESDHAGTRALKNALLVAMLSTGSDEAISIALEQFHNATNMTDRLGALTALLASKDDDTQVVDALNAYYREFEHEPLAIDKWFSLQATIAGERGLERVGALLRHEAFTLQNPNRARSLLGVFTMRNLSAFHQADGFGYELFAEQVLAIDKFNPQLAARLLTSMNNWRTLEPGRREKAQAVLSDIAATTGLSRDTSEIVDRCLEK